MPIPFKNLLDLGGLRTNLPADKIPDRNASECRNIDFSISGQIQTRKGKTRFANEISEAGENLTGFLYRKNYGTLKKILLRVRDDGTNSHLEWLNPDNPDTADGKWETLIANLTQGAKMGFAPFNKTNENKLVFCNGEDPLSFWNGATATVSSVTSSTIVANEDLASEGFDSSGSVLIDGTEYSYTGISGNTFTGVTPDPTAQNPDAGTGIAQKPDTSHSSLPKGNILLTAAARLWVAGVKDRESTLYYSKVGDPTDFTVGTNPDDAGIEDFPDAGGAITLLDSKDNNRIIVFKENGILLFRLEYTDTAKIPYLDVLTLSEDCGATNFKAGAGLNHVVYFVSAVEGLKELARAIDGDGLNLASISDVILPTIKDYDFSDAAAVYNPSKREIKVACKSSSDEQHNNKVITYYLQLGAGGLIVNDISIDDDFVADWIVDGNNLYALSSIDQNVYLYYGQKSNNGTSINHVWVSKEFTFNEPARGKEFNTLYVEGFIAAHTKIKITVLYGLLGSGGSVTKIISWDDDFVSTQEISALGTDVIGTVSLGASSQEILESRAFSVPIHIDINKATRYKIKIETYYDNETTEESYWAISNIATNPVLKNIDYNQVINSNV